MKTRTTLIHEGDYAVALSVEVVEPAPGWEPCIPLADALKLDETRAALKAGDLQTAAQHGQVYHLVPLTA